MHSFINIFGFSIPSYGLLITIGLITANAIAFMVIHHRKDDINDFIILEASGMLGAFLGSKLLYLLVSIREIPWGSLTLSDFCQLMQGGFVFYGGLLGALFFIPLAGKLFQIDAFSYLKNYIFILPFLHSFGRIGCFMAGCCYGIPYTGSGAVVFPDNSLALSGISLFPIQIVEAALLFCIFVILILLCINQKEIYSVSVYLILYGIVRFLLEFLRYDQRRGFVFHLSVSQWISITVILSTLLYTKRRSSNIC